MRRGATLVEVLIAVGVSAMLSGLVVVYGTGGRQNTSLYVDAVKLAQTILRAKSQAVLIYYNPENPVCGYGIRTITGNGVSAYALFRYAVTEGESCSAISEISSSDPRYVEIQRFPLASGVSFGPASTIDTVFFIPPDPLTILWKGNGKVKPSGNIDLIVGNGSNKRSVTITTSGQITY